MFCQRIIWVCPLFSGGFFCCILFFTKTVFSSCSFNLTNLSAFSSPQTTLVLKILQIVHCLSPVFSRVLKLFEYQLPEVVLHISQEFLFLHLWDLNHYRAEAPTWNLIKTLESLVLGHIILLVSSVWCSLLSYTSCTDPSAILRSNVREMVSVRSYVAVS